jgi:hypothetical protein
VSDTIEIRVKVRNEMSAGLASARTRRPLRGPATPGTGSPALPSPGSEQVSERRGRAGRAIVLDGGQIGDRAGPGRVAACAVAADAVLRLTGLVLRAARGDQRRRRGGVRRVRSARTGSATRSRAVRPAQKVRRWWGRWGAVAARQPRRNARSATPSTRCRRPQAGSSRSPRTPPATSRGRNGTRRRPRSNRPATSRRPAATRSGSPRKVARSIEDALDAEQDATENLNDAREDAARKLDDLREKVSTTRWTRTGPGCGCWPRRPRNARSTGTPPPRTWRRPKRCRTSAKPRSGCPTSNATGPPTPPSWPPRKRRGWRAATRWWPPANAWRTPSRALRTSKDQAAERMADAEQRVADAIENGRGAAGRRTREPRRHDP